MNPYDRTLELRRDNMRIRLYNDHDHWRVYNGMRLVYDGDDHSMAYRIYNQEV